MSSNVALPQTVTVRIHPEHVPFLKLLQRKHWNRNRRPPLAVVASLAAEFALANTDYINAAIVQMCRYCNAEGVNTTIATRRVISDASRKLKASVSRGD